MLQCETHSKDHRPDLQQLVWILTVSADGAVPIAFRVADGNTADVTTHIDTWDALVALTGEVGFLYIALCGCPHNDTYAEVRIMPSVAVNLQVRAVSVTGCSA